MELERYISELKNIKATFANQEKLKLIPSLNNCAGNTPPPLTGASVTYLNGKIYLFGGKIANSTKVLSDIYIFNIHSKKWNLIKDKVEENQNQSKAGNRDSPNLENKNMYKYSSVPNKKNISPKNVNLHDAMEQKANRARFFHTGVAYRDYLIFFGGIGFRNSDPDPKKTEKSENQNNSNFLGIKGKNISVFKLFSSSQAGLDSPKSRTNKSNSPKRVLLNDIIVFDTINEKWIDIKDIKPSKTNTQNFQSKKTTQNNGVNTFDPNTSIEVMVPQPRYAHLASLVFDNKMIVVGGQGLLEEYVKEFNVYDFSTHKWVHKKLFENEVSKYRSTLVGVPDGGAVLFSNYNFTNTKHTFSEFCPGPDYQVCQIELDDNIIKPPGLRFPSGHMVDRNTILISGTITNADLTYAVGIWTYNFTKRTWKDVLSGSVHNRESWKDGVVSSTTNQLIMFGDSNRTIDIDYKSRQNNYKQCLEINLIGLGLARQNTNRSDVFFSNMDFLEDSHLEKESIDPKFFADAMINGSNLKNVAQELGLLALSMKQFTNTWIETTDGKWVPVNTELLKKRSICMCESWGIIEMNENEHRRVSGSYNYVSNNSIIEIGESRSNTEKKKSSQSHFQALAKKGNLTRVTVPESSDVIIPLIKFLYTGILEVSPTSTNFRISYSADVVKKKTITILSRLIALGHKWRFTELTAAAVLLLYQQVDSSTALLVLDAIHQSRFPEIESLCLTVLKQSGNLKDRQNNIIWNNISESTRHFVESKLSPNRF
ncbi:hypothetical protein BB558_004445 [Smittium angustum]|uniref:BTB domain-containing protein n=1 Tax=Smittium angustum TaxID=133377 RepID=A0A2U1J3A2_SMIAN|nr:hypothetical protein BB558_004445 [Smittium angustum]